MAKLIIGDLERLNIQEIVAYAKAHPFTIDNLKSMVEGAMIPVGDIPFYVTTLPVGYRVVFSYEYQMAGLCRHISISVEPIGKLPAPSAVEMIMEEFGFVNQLDSTGIHLHVEDVGGGKFAINVLEVINEPTN